MRTDAVALRDKPYTIYVDVFSHCNLRCPSCPVGNKYGEITAWPRGLMAPEFLGKIVDKALSECHVAVVGLYNWTEPGLHPNLPELVREVKRRGVPCALSSNLNVLPDPDRLLAENPDWFRVSASGFTQQIYEIGHRGGHIEIVKQNMVRLAEAKKRTNAQTHLQAFYHRYVHNEHEVEAFGEFARSLGFEFATCFAQIFPVEKIIDISRGKTTRRDEQILNQLLLPLDQALQVTREKAKDECYLLEDIIAIDVEGNVMLCCGSSMERSNTIAPFLDTPLDQIQALRRQNSLCGSCLSLGIPDYFRGEAPEFDTIAKSRLEQDRSARG